MTSSPVVAGIGEMLWDVYPDGAHFGGAPANFACHAASLECYRRAMLAERNRLWTLWRFADGPTIRAGLWLAVRRVIHAPRLRHVEGLLAGLAGMPRRRGERRRARRRLAS